MLTNKKKKKNLRRELICSKRDSILHKREKTFNESSIISTELKVAILRKPEPPGDLKYNSTWYSIPITLEIVSVTAT